MHKIDLETFNLERLIQSVDPEIFHLGVDLYEQGRAAVQELAELSAVCTVQDPRKHRVQFKIDKQRLLLKCSCSHASRGLICEHDVAAWLAVRDRLVELAPAEWQTRIERLLATSNGSRPRPRPAPYYLFFSLQKDPAGGDPAWRILPHILPLNALPKSLQPGPQTQPDWAAITSGHPELTARMRQPFQPLDPEGCLNAGREAVGLANLIYERKRFQNLASQPALKTFLPLVRQVGGLVALGSLNQPFERRVEILPAAGETRLQIERSSLGLHLSLQFSVQDATLEFEGQPLQLLNENPIWVLIGERVVELKDRASLDLLLQFQDYPEIYIPASDEAAFADNYLLELSQQAALAGGGVAWDEIECDPTPRLYLNESGGELLIQLRFAYDGYELPYSGAFQVHSLRHELGSMRLVKIQRKPLEEQAVYDLLISSAIGLKRAPLPAKPGFFRLRARAHPVDFILNTLPRLASDGIEIYGEEKLKTARVNRHTPTISFQVSSGINWFDVQTTVNFGELEVPLKEFRRLVRKNERYVKLSDGSIGELPEEWLERYRHLFTVGDLQEDHLRFARQHVTLIEQALASADSVIQEDEFAHRRARLRGLLKGEFSGIQARPLPQGFVGELRPYQKAGVDWLHFLHEHELGGCLADDMGLGKTIQALVFLRSLYEPNGAETPHAASLLVVPRSLLVNWQREAARFTPGLKILEYFESSRVKDLEAFNEHDLIITTYGVMLRDIQLLHRYEFYYAILDESQSIKNPLSQTARAAHLLRSKNRLALTGTPLENSTSELWSQFAFLNPGLLGNLKYFKNEFGLPIEKKYDDQAAERLRRIVYPFILRRTKDQVAPELPPRSERTLYCDMEPAQRRLYLRTREAYRGLLMGMLDKDGLDESRMKVLEGLLRLRQIANHPLLVDETFHGASGKFDLLIETLETLRAENHKALIFSQFVKMLSLVRLAIEERGIPYTYLDGQTQARQGQVDRFQSDPEVPFFLISLRAGGLGLNLTAADYVIHIDPWWNPAVEMQASDRTHRIGQDKPVFVYKLITRDSVEEKILQLQERKKDLVDQIITTESAFFKTLGETEILALFES